MLTPSENGWYREKLSPGETQPGCPVWHQAACLAGDPWLESQLHHFLPAGPWWFSFCGLSLHICKVGRMTSSTVSAVVALTLTDFSCRPLLLFRAHERLRSPGPPVIPALAASVEP